MYVYRYMVILFENFFIESIMVKYYFSKNLLWISKKE